VLTCLRWAERGLEALVALLLFIMVALVFLNVVLRYGFHSGIIWTDEVTEIVMTILIFAGAVLALVQRQHISMTLLVERLPDPAVRVIALIGGAIMLYCDWLLGQGAFLQAGLAWSARYAVSGLPQATTYVVACAAAVLLAAIIAIRMALVAAGRLAPQAFFARTDAEALSTEGGLD